MRRRSIFTLLGCGVLLVMVCGAVAMFGFAFNRSRASDEPPAKNSIVYGLTLQPSGFDPHINASSELGIVLRSVYDTLVYRDPKEKKFVPGLALQTTISQDGKEYTFKLRQDVKFHDGTPFNAQAVARTLDRITSKDTKSQKAIFLLGTYDRYELLDQFTIKLVLKEPYAPLLDALSQVYLGIASPTALQTWESAVYQFHQVGTGPFRFVEYIPGDRLVVRRNPDYTWGPEFYQPVVDDSVDEIVFRFFTEPATRAPALESGEAAIMGELSPTDARGFAGNGDLRLIPQTVPGLPMQWFFNTSRAPTDSIEVRQALLYATNRAAVVESVFQEFAPVAYGPLSASTPFYSPEMQKLYTFDTERGLTLFKSKGWELRDGKLTRSGTPMKLVMVVPRWGFHPEIAQKLQSVWKEIGIELELRVVPNLAGVLAEQQKGEYNLIAFNDYGVDASVLNRFYLSESTSNWTGYKNVELDSWITNATQTIDTTKRGASWSRHSSCRSGIPST
jgi:peptide/nickel transport system substrate-binding protein